MINAWILLPTILLAPGVETLVLYNSQHSLCLHESKTTGEVLLKVCSLESESQQWVWIDGGMLMCLASSKCLLAIGGEPLRTHSCKGVGADPSVLMWSCDEGRIISRNTSMFLSVDGQQPALSRDNKYSTWKNLDAGDICSQSLRYKRSSNEATENPKSASMTEEQREYLRWFYRTEDPTTWKFVLMGVAFLCLLAGFLLLGLGAMANKNRKEIAKYKAAAMAQTHGEELRGVPQESKSGLTPSGGSPLLVNKPSPPNSGDSDLKAGNIVVTWNDGNVSQLFQSPSADDDNVAGGDEAEVTE